jgi:hypothetical protein
MILIIGTANPNPEIAKEISQSGGIPGIIQILSKNSKVEPLIRIICALLSSVLFNSTYIFIRYLAKYQKNIRRKWFRLGLSNSSRI